MLKIIFFFLTALGGVQKSNRSFHFSSCTSWSQRELGNDIGIQIIHCSKFIPTSKYVYFLHMCTHTRIYMCVCVCVCVSLCVYISHMLFLSIEENFYEEKKFSPLSTDKFLNLRAMLSSYACYHVLKVPWAVCFGNYRPSFTLRRSNILASFHFRGFWQSSSVLKTWASQTLRFFMVWWLVDWHLDFLWL